jgi:hypothetical protein
MAYIESVECISADPRHQKTGTKPRPEKPNPDTSPTAGHEEPRARIAVDSPQASCTPNPFGVRLDED